MRTKSAEISPSALRLLDITLSLMENNQGVWPTVRHIARAVGYSSTNTVAYHIRALLEANIIERNPCLRYGLYRLVERKDSNG